MFDTITYVEMFAAFLIAGTVKGIVGVGLPTISLGLLTAILDLPTAMALVIVPSMLANLLQAATGGAAMALLRRLWPFLGCAAATVWIGTTILTLVDVRLLTALLGVIVIAYSTVSLSGFRVEVARQSERWAGPAIGLVNGVVTGMTGSYAFPGILYLQALGLPRDALIQAMGILFAVSTAALAVSLGGAGLLPAQLGLLSVAGLVPVFSGMAIGRRIRKRMSEERFRMILYISLLALGAFILIRSIYAIE